MYDVTWSWWWWWWWWWWYAFGLVSVTPIFDRV